MKIDLHIHSSASDGSFSPARILALARAAGLGAIAITDHDTLDGSREALALAERSGIDFLSGVEISAEPPPRIPCAGSFHLLGYGFDINDPQLNQTLSRLQRSRENRYPAILEKLNALGMPLAPDALRKRFGADGQLGRPHIAQLMVDAGRAASIDDAFDRFLGRGRPAFVDKYRVGCDAAIAAIAGAGGVAVLAHPVLVSPGGGATIEDLVAALTDMGLGGIEAYYSEHTPAQTARYARIARNLGLAMTGGTDFHGDFTPDIRLGVGKGDLSVPYDLYERLMERLAAPRKTDDPAAGWR